MDDKRSYLGLIPSLTTREVPNEYWNEAFLTGRIPIRALKSDTRISYALYVPHEHYSNPEDGKKLSLLVSIHGTRRNMSTSFDSLISFADSTPCAVLAPLFPAGLDGPNDLNSYQILKSATLRSDLCLLQVLDEISTVWPGIETSTIFLMGFSGGGQFVHRFMYLYPERLAAVSIGAPGNVTTLDDTQPWPTGIKDTEKLFGRLVEKDKIRKLSIQLIVGGADTTIRGGTGLLVWLLKRKAQQNGLIDGKEENLPTPREKNRIETLPKLKAQWMEEGINARLDVVEGVAHESHGVRELVLKFIEPLIKTCRTPQ